MDSSGSVYHSGKVVFLNSTSSTERRKNKETEKQRDGETNRLTNIDRDTYVEDRERQRDQETWLVGSSGSIYHSGKGVFSNELKDLHSGYRETKIQSVREMILLIHIPIRQSRVFQRYIKFRETEKHRDRETYRLTKIVRET